MTTYNSSILGSDCISRVEAGALGMLHSKEKLPEDKYVEYIWRDGEEFGKEIGEILKSLPDKVKVGPRDHVTTGDHPGRLHIYFNRVYIPLKYYLALKEFLGF